MSQHRFNTMRNSLPISVMIGWDRPLGYFFLVIEGEDQFPELKEDDDEDDEFDGTIYSTLFEERPFSTSLEDIKQKLLQFDITIPEAMFEQAQSDRASNVGNRFVKYNIDGTFIESDAG